MRLIIFTIFLLTGIPSYSQERILVNDPDVSFSYIQETRWQPINDPYYYYIVNSENPEAKIALTYFDKRCQDLEECFEAERYAGVPSEVSQYQEEKTGSTTISSRKAKWLEYTYIDTECKCVHTARNYYFISFDQYFIVRYDSESRYYKKHLEEAVSQITSLQISGS